MNLSLNLPLLSRFGAGEPAAAGVADVPRPQLVWLAQALSAVMRKSITVEAVTDSVPLADAQRMLRQQGIETRALSPQDWLDEAKTPSGTPVVVVGPDGAVRLVLGHKDGSALVATFGDTKPQSAALSELLPSIEAATLLAVTAQEEAPEVYGWKWFLKAFFARKAVIRDALIASLVIQLIALAFPLATQAIVDKVITNQATSTLIALGIGIALFAVFNGLASWLRQKLLLRLAAVVDGELSTRVMAHLFRLPLRYFENRATGVLVTRIHGVERVREFASGAFLLLAMDLPFMLIFLALMLSYSVTLSAIVMGFVTFMVGLSFAVGPQLRELANRHFEAGAKVQGFVTERIAANETVKSLQLENLAVHQFNGLNRNQIDAALNTREFSNSYGTVMQVAEQLMHAAVLCTGAWLVMTGGSLTIGMLVAFQMFSQRVSQPLLRLSGMWQELQQVRIAVAQLGDVMSTDTERYGLAPTSVAGGEKRGRLAAERLAFRHGPERPPLFENLSFSLEPGQVLLLTGPSGSGKSTLAKLMLGLYQGYEGAIKLDGRDTRSMPVNELRTAFGVVPQETVLFAGTVAENVMAGSAEATLEQAVRACKLAGVHEAVENLPNGYQTVLGERGVGLSGGQRQRIGIARALLRRPTVLLFDEATSGLDEAAAEHIAQTVNALRGRVTMVFVAHRVPKGLQVDQHVDLASKMS